MRVCNNTTCVSVVQPIQTVNMIQDQILVRLNSTDSSAVRSLHDTAVAAGANDTSLAGYGIRNPKPYLAQAREAAVSNARSDADMLASAAGVRVGRVLNIYEYQPAAIEAMMLTSTWAPSLSSKIDVTSDVVVTYEILQ